MKENGDNSNSKGQEKNVKIIVGIIYMLILFFSAANKFINISIEHNTLNMNMFEVKGVALVLLSAVVYIYSLFTKKKNSYYISIIFLFIGYSYTFYTFLNLEKAIGAMPASVAEQMHFGIGLFGYIISFIFLIIDLFIPMNSKSKEKNPYIEKIEQSIEGESQYILANYIFGIEKRPDLYKKISVIAIKKDEPNVEIIVNLDAPEKIIIPKLNIHEITSKPSIINKDSLRLENNNDTSKIIRDIALFGGPAAIMINSLKKDKVIEYYKMETTKVYDIQFCYTLDNQEKKLLFQTKENPEYFLVQLKEEVNEVKSN